MSQAPLISDLPVFVIARDWEWTPFPGKPQSPTHGFWLGTDRDGQRWLTKLRGRERGMRELAFARLAQRLGWSCQSSIFVSIPKNSRPRQANTNAEGIQLAHWLYEEADYSEPGVSALLERIDEDLNTSAIHPIDVIRGAPIKSFIDWPRSDVAAALFGATETCGRLLTRDLTNVVIDSELMFASGPDQSLNTTWLQADRSGEIKGLSLTLEVCEAVATLSTDDLDSFAKPPERIRIPLKPSIARVLRAAKLVAEMTVRLGRPPRNRS